MSVNAPLFKGAEQPVKGIALICLAVLAVRKSRRAVQVSVGVLSHRHGGVGAGQRKG